MMNPKTNTIPNSSCLTLPLLIVGFGTAYGTAKPGLGISAMGVMRPELILKSVIPVVMSGIIGIYGLIVSVLISNNRKFIS